VDVSTGGVLWALLEPDGYDDDLAKNDSVHQGHFVTCARQADAGLDRLLSLLLTTRSNMRQELASQPPDARRQEIARGRLLVSLEAYASGLSARGLAAPPALRDELALQRNLARST
jgi:hypothetical protein